MTHVLAAIAGLALGLLLRPGLARTGRRLLRRPRPDSPEQAERRAQLALLDGRARAAVRPAVAFLGDSLLHRMELAEWFSDAGHPVLNRAVGGDRTEHVAGALATLPELAAAVLLVGANDVLHAGVERDGEEVARRVAGLAADVAARGAPATYVVSLLPTASERANAELARANRRLAEGAASAGYAFVDLAPDFTGPGGRIRPELTTDGVHLSAEGMARLAAGLRAAVRELAP